MRVLFLGPTAIGQTSRMRARALERLGHEVRSVDTAAPWKEAPWLARRLGRKTARGRIVDRINNSVSEAARSGRFDLIWAEKQEFLRAETMANLRATQARLVHFTPDPYFTLAWKRTRLMDRAIGEFDVLVYCKSYERRKYEELGKPVVYMPLGYCDEVHRRRESVQARWRSDVGFLGGWEPRRETYLAPIADLPLDLRIWGGYWDFLRDGKKTLRRRVILRQLAGGIPFEIRPNPNLAKCLQGGEVYGDDYARALSGGRIGVGFLRKVCPDQHTTRSFEIPACGSLLLADRTDEHCEFFEEGTEAEFFGSAEEFKDKVSYYARNESARARVAQAGMARCEQGKYAYIHRLDDVLTKIARI